MALELPFADPFGRDNPQSYWYWVGLTVNALTGQCVITLHGYADAQAAATGKQPVGTKQIVVAGQAFAELVQHIAPGISPEVYQRAKQDPFFAGAVEV